MTCGEAFLGPGNKEHPVSETKETASFAPEMPEAGAVTNGSDSLHAVSGFNARATEEPSALPRYDTLRTYSLMWLIASARRKRRSERADSALEEGVPHFWSWIR